MIILGFMSNIRMVSHWYTVGYLHGVEEGRVGQVSEVYAASVFRVKKLHKFKRVLKL
jgi:hypothetical protein